MRYFLKMAQIRQAKNAKHRGAISGLVVRFDRHKKAELMLGFLY